MKELDESHIRIQFKAKNNKLLTERERLGLNQIEMAKELGVRIDHYGMMERFQKVPKDVLEKTAFELRVDPADLFPEWAQDYGFAVNAGKKYFLVDDEIAQGLIDTNPEPTMVKLLQQSLQTDIEEVLKTLTPREANVVRYYFGINRTHNLTLEEIASEYGLSKERVREIKNKAIRKLRHRDCATTLRNYLGVEQL